MTMKRNNETNNMPRLLMGGMKVKQIEAPFAVHLQYRQRGISSSCAGTMISDRHILTAAHCFINKDCERGTVSEMFSARKWKVYYGGGCLPFAKDTCSKFQQMARSINAQNIVIPTSYLSGPCLHNDIAIVITRLRMGDSGSGLMFKAVNGSWNIAGIASAGTDCRVINMAINIRKKPPNVVQLDGSIFIDVRAHNDFICQYSGLCFGEQPKNRQKVKAILL